MTQPVHALAQPADYGIGAEGAGVAVGGDTGQAGLTGLRLFHARDKMAGASRECVVWVVRRV